MRDLLLPLLCCIAWVFPVHAQVGALEVDCKLGGGGGADGYQFVATCPGRAKSPDGRFAVVQRPYRDRQPPIWMIGDARSGRVERARFSRIGTIAACASRAGAFTRGADAPKKPPWPSSISTMPA
jgi:hypothetical protein